MVCIIDENQKVKIKWMTRNKYKYIGLGYNFTKLYDEFEIPIKHLNDDSSKRVLVCCDECKKEIMTPFRNYNRIVSNSGSYRCRQCNSKNVSEIRINNNKEKELLYFNKEMKRLGYTPVATKNDYEGYTTPLGFICKTHGLQFLSINQLRQGCVCPECGKSIKGLHAKKTITDVIKIVESKNNNKLLNPEEYKNVTADNLKIKCGSCGEVFITSLASIQGSGGRCPSCGFKRCGETNRLSYDNIVKKASVGDVCYLINPEDYVNSSIKNLLFKCVSCGAVFKKSLNHFSRGENRCKKCTSKSSQGEYTISCILDKFNIKYIQQKRFQDCRDTKPLPFDFFLPDHNCCIEFDGYQHHNIAVFDTQKSFDKRQEHDKMKTNYCKDKNIKLIRIPYWEYNNIEEILKNELCIM